MMSPLFIQREHQSWYEVGQFSIAGVGQFSSAANILVLAHYLIEFIASDF